MDELGRDHPDAAQVTIRPVAEADFPVIRKLFYDGLSEGNVPVNDTGADIENVAEAYLSDNGSSCFWVAELNGDVVGMVGVQHTVDNTAEIRRLRVRADKRRRGIGAKLMEQAISFCRHHAYLKVVLDVRLEHEPAIALFGKFAFQLARRREVAGRCMLDFYLDLYREPEG
jgi:ribosomal protein S18 acetylase RimI-like enzyme